MHCAFFAGTAIIGGTTVYMLVKSIESLEKMTWCSVALLTVSVVFFVMLIYTLFFALPFDETYLNENGKRPAYTEGVYALCRHPGVLWFVGFYMCVGAGMADRALLLYGIVVSLWNVLYIVFQDLYSFPKTFYNYMEYKQETPFLIPDRKSVRKCLLTLRRGRR